MMYFALVFTIWTQAGPAMQPSARDPWFGRDKFLHFAASAAIQTATHSVLRANGADYARASRAAAMVTLTAGVSKEIWDHRRGGDASWRDLTWDAIGGATGAVVIRQTGR